MPDDVPIEAKMVTNAIRSAQSQVEAQNFEIRKDVLKYDEVLNRQRKVIYAERRRCSRAPTSRSRCATFVDDVIDDYVAAATAEGFAEEWDLDAAVDRARHALPDRRSRIDELVERPAASRTRSRPSSSPSEVSDDAQAAYERARGGARRGGRPRARASRRALGARPKWREHLYEMDYLQEGIGLRAMAQKDPLVEYQREGYDLFRVMMEAIKEESVGYSSTSRSRRRRPTPRTPPPRACRSATRAPRDRRARAWSSRGAARALQYTAPTVDGEAASSSRGETAAR